jgi:hypothetical protein
MKAQLLALAPLVLVLAACSSETKRSGGAETVVVPAPGETPLLEDACCPVPNADGSQIAFTRPRWGGRAVEGERSKLDVEVMVADAAAARVVPLTRGFVAGWTSTGEVLAWRDGTVFAFGYDGHVREFKLGVRANGEWPDRVSSLASKREVVYANVGANETLIETVGDGGARVLARHPNQAAPLGELVVPSPDERYLAVLDASFVTPMLRVFDQATGAWTKFGSIVVYPQATAGHWDSLKPRWNPWFPDGAHLTFATASGVHVATPDGKNTAELAHVSHAGLPTPSPDGQSVAFVTLDLVPRRDAPGSNNIEDVQLWVVAARPGATPRPLTGRSNEATVALAWLNPRELVYDRVSWFTEDPRRETAQPRARIYKAAVPPEPAPAAETK